MYYNRRSRLNDGLILGIDVASLCAMTWISLPPILIDRGTRIFVTDWSSDCRRRVCKRKPRSPTQYARELTMNGYFYVKGIVTHVWRESSVTGVVFYTSVRSHFCCRCADHSSFTSEHAIAPRSRKLSVKPMKLLSLHVH